MAYFNFKTWEDKNKWICKSEINRGNMRKMHIPDFVKLDDIKKVFDSIDDPFFVRWVLVGNSLNPKQRKHVKYVSKFALYKALVRG